jgi:N4-bis(aminopropyl)spermidine synthase
MASLDLRSCLNAISDVVNNRPRPLREFDQIFMKTADMLFQTEHVGRYFDNKEVVFIGDGDAIGLCLAHLHHKKLLPKGPKRVHVLDFDERVVLSIREFAKRYEVADYVTAELYNVADPLPPEHWQKFNAFYTNPPYGQRNDGRSIEAFLTRAIQAVSANAAGCVVLADDKRYPWTQTVLLATQRFGEKQGFVVSELLPEFHLYHLDDSPDLRSCSMILQRLEFQPGPYASEPLPKPMLVNFYGKEAPLNVKYVRDLTNGGKFPSRDHKLEPL